MGMVSKDSYASKDRYNWFTPGGELISTSSWFGSKDKGGKSTACVPVLEPFEPGVHIKGFEVLDHWI